MLVGMLMAAADWAESGSSSAEDEWNGGDDAADTRPVPGGGVDSGHR